MKIKGKLIIPLIAILIAMFTLGVTPGVAADTTTSDTLTYVAPEIPPTSSIEEEVEAFISNNFGDDLVNAEDDVRGFSELMERFLTTIRDALNKIIAALESIGGMAGSGGGFLGGIL